MIVYEIPQPHGLGKAVYHIYEKHDPPPVGRRIFNHWEMDKAMRGEWVRDVNGKIVPVLRRVEFTRKKGTRPGKEVLLIFPGFSWMVRAYEDRPFCYPDEPRFRTKGISPSHALFAKLLSKGLEWDRAMGIAFPKLPPRARKLRAMTILNNDTFIILYLEEAGIMADLKKHLADAHNITDVSVIDMLVDIMKDKDEAASLRKYAIETIFGLTSEKKPERNTSPQEELKETLAEMLSAHQSTSQRSLAESLPAASLMPSGEALDVEATSGSKG